MDFSVGHARSGLRSLIVMGGTFCTMDIGIRTSHLQRELEKTIVSEKYHTFVNIVTQTWISSGSVKSCRDFNAHIISARFI